MRVIWIVSIVSSGHSILKNTSSSQVHMEHSPGLTTSWVTNQTSVQFRSVAQSCPTLCDPLNHSTPGLPVHNQLLESTQTQTHVHWVGDAIQPCHPLSSPPPPALSLSQHQGLFEWVSSSHQVAKTANRTAIQPSNPTAGHAHRGNQNWKRHMCPSVHRSVVYSS